MSRFAIAIALFVLLVSVAAAQDDAPPIREIFVPFEDLNVILDNDKHRVFLTREEYAELVRQAKARPQTPAPHKVVLSAAEYTGELQEGRALLSGTLRIEVLEEGLFALPLEIGGVGIRRALLDGKPAPLSRNESQQPVLLVQGKGMHRLELALTAPLQTAAASQTLQVTLPTNAAARLKLTVPGNVEVKGGGAVVSRTYEMAANRTELEVLPPRGGMSLVMSLNNRLTQEQQVVVARSVIVDEITQGYERIHATLSFRPLHGAVERLRIAVPAGFEITSVGSHLLARWEEKTDAAGVKTLEATLREPVTEQIVLQVTANRSPAADADWLAGLADWKFPKLEPLDVAGHVAVLGVLLEDRLKPQKIEATDLLPIDSAALSGAIPASVLAAEPGAPSVRQVATFYAPAAQYELSASFVRPAAGLKVAGNSLLVIGDRQLTLQGGFALSPEAESIFAFSFTVPAGWQVTQVTAEDGSVLPFERYPIDDGGTRLAVKLVAGISAGQTKTVNYQALHTPAGWLTDWQTQKLTYPQVRVAGATSSSGAIAAQAIDDLLVRPESLTGLTPLLDNEKAAFGLGDIPTAQAFRYESSDYAASLAIERKKPSLTARVFSFFKLERDNLLAHYELQFEVREASTRTLAFSLDKSTPTELDIRGLDGAVVKEFEFSDDGPSRRWSVQLAERHFGPVKLSIGFEQPYEVKTLTSAGLPLVQAENVEYQSAIFAVEADPELEVEVTTAARAVDPGELAAAGSYVIGRRLIGGYGYSGNRPKLTVQVDRRETHPLPLALIQRAELVTKVSAGARQQEDGSYAALAQSVARYDLLTKATLLEIQLPAGSHLWSIVLDDRPTKPQKEGESLLVSLPAQEQVTARKLQIVYESPSQPLGLSGTIEAQAPLLLVRAAGTDEEREIPQADLQWQLLLPGGYEVRRVGGTVSTDVPQRPMAAVKVAAFLYTIAGGVQPWWMVAREASRSDSKSAITWGGAEYSYDSDATTTTENFAEGYAMPSEDTPPASETMSPAPRSDDAVRDMPAALPLPAEEPAPPAPEFSPQPATPAAPPLVENLEQSRQQMPQEGREDVNLAPEEADEGKKAQLFALEGFSSLRIDIRADEEPDATFHSLGARPRLEAGVIDVRRIYTAAWGLSFLVFLVGIGMTRRPSRDKATYVIVVLVASTVPLLLTTALDEVGVVFDFVFFAGCALVAWYLIAAVVLAVARWVKGRLPADCCRPVAAQQIVAVLVAAGLLVGSDVCAQQAPPDESLIPVAVPVDAIIIPYDPEKPLADAARNKLLVPYAKYVELWNVVHPEKRIDTAPPPREFAIAGAAYEATLGSGDFLSLTGRLEIEVFTDKPLTVPLALAGGVLERATVDGQAARLQVVEPQAAANAPEQPPQAEMNVAPNADHLPPRLLVLHLAGKGRKSVQLHLRLGLSRQGGWRMVRSQVPVGPAGALTLTVPQAGTEIRQTSLPDKPAFETTRDNENIETSLPASGALELQWRPKIAEGQVDQALTAKSIALFDVREDALRLVWQLDLEFGRGTRDAFTISAPADYLVEQVLGDNVRGWTTKTEADSQRIEVTLLKAATGSETLTLHLAKRGRVGEGELAEFDAPAILVEGAALEQGTISVRRSPRLDLRTIGSVGLSRADNEGQAQPLEQLADAADAAVLVVRPHQSFRFVKPPFRLTLAASALPRQATAYVRAALQALERGTTFDAAITFRPEGQPLYQVRLVLPEGFTVERVGPGDLEWSVTDSAPQAEEAPEANGRQTLTVQLLDGRTEEFTLTVYGKIERRVGAAAKRVDQAAVNPGGQAASSRTLPLPKLEILDVEKQEGEIVVVTDRDTDVRLDDVKAGEASPLTNGPGWMVAEQQGRARAVLRYRSPEYSATVVLTPRQPIVSARSITNVKITSQAIEETVVLDFRIEQAGIRSVSFLVPEHLAKGRIRADLLQQKIVEPATDSEGQLVPGWVRVRLVLQDYVDGEYRVVLEHDRLLSADKQTVKLPVIETGRTNQRLLAIENAGRDEVDPQQAVGLESLSSQQQAWRDLVGALQGGSITQAFAAIETASRPQLVFSLRQRERVADDGARIDLATTIMVVDEAGTYRALQEYRVFNATLQYLEVEMPAGARLWTATVAGEPVKAAAGANPALVRIPLIKSAAGEGDYPVQLKYGGQMPRPGLFTSARFPFIKTVNVNVELSQVQLWLPETREWFGFFGTMREETAEEQALGFQNYLNSRIEEASQLLASADDYTKARVAFNLRQSRLLLDNSSSMQAQNDLKQLGIAVHNQYESNIGLLNQAEQQAQLELAQPQGEVLDNRGRLNQYWEQQDLKRSKGVASELGSNFDAAGTAITGMKGKDANLNEKWFDQNKLRAGAEQADKPGEKSESKPADIRFGEAGDQSGRFFRGGKPSLDDMQQQGQMAGEQQKAPQIAGKEQLDELHKKLDEQDREIDGRKRSGEQAQNLQRYQQQLQQKTEDEQALNLYGQSPGQQPQVPARPGSGSGAGFGGGFGAQPQLSANAAGGMAGPSTAADPFAAPQDAPVIPSTHGAPGSQSLTELAQGRASLDISLPERGRLYRFTTPRGDIEIEAYSISHRVLGKLMGLAAVLVAIVVVWLLGRERSRHVWRAAFRTLAFGIALVVLGLASVISGVLPFAGLLLIVGGLVLSIRAAWRPSPARVAAA